MYLKDPENQLAFAEKSDFLEDLFNLVVHVESEDNRNEIIDSVKKQLQNN